MGKIDKILIDLNYFPMETIYEMFIWKKYWILETKIRQQKLYFISKWIVFWKIYILICSENLSNYYKPWMDTQIMFGHWIWTRALLSVVLGTVVLEFGLGTIFRDNLIWKKILDSNVWQKKRKFIKWTLSFSFCMKKHFKYLM